MNPDQCAKIVFTYFGLFFFQVINNLAVVISQNAWQYKKKPYFAYDFRDLWPNIGESETEWLHPGKGTS